MAKPDDVTGHAAHFGGYLAGWAVGKGTPFLFVEDDTSTEKKHGIWNLSEIGILSCNLFAKQNMVCFSPLIEAIPPKREPNRLQTEIRAFRNARFKPECFFERSRMVQVIFPVEVTHVPGHDLLLTSFQCRMTRMMLIFYGFLESARTYLRTVLRAQCQGHEMWEISTGRNRNSLRPTCHMSELSQPLIHRHVTYL